MQCGRISTFTGPATGGALDTLRVLGGFTRDGILDYLGVDRRTWERWLAGTSRIPPAVWELLRIRAAGELPAGTTTDWVGWRFSDGRLYDPADTWHTPETIRVWHWTAQQLADLDARDRLKHPYPLSANVGILPSRATRLRGIIRDRLAADPLSPYK